MNSFFYRTLVRLLLIVGLFSANNIFAQTAEDFYATDKIQDISIDFPQNNWRYLLDSLRYNGDELLNATVRVNGQSFDHAGVRYRDGGTFTPGGRRNSLFIDLDVNDAKQYAGLSEVELSAATRDPSMVREVIGYELARKYFPAPMANYAKVKINNDYYGLMVNVEVVNKDFMNRAFGAEKGDLFFATAVTVEEELDCHSNIYGTLKKDKSEACLQTNFVKQAGDWSDLQNLTVQLKNHPEEIAQIMDVDEVLWMLAYNNVFLNLKSYSGKYSYNYYVARPENGRFVTLLGRSNLSFGSYKNTGLGSDLKPAQMIRLSVLLHEDNERKPLLNILLSNDVYQKHYIAHVRQIMADIKKYNLKKRIEGLHALIYTDFVNDKNRYYSTQDLSNSIMQTIGKRSKIPGVVKLVEERRSFLKTENLLKVVPPRVDAVSFVHRKQFSNEKVKSFKVMVTTTNHAKHVIVHYRYNHSGAFETMKLKDDGKHFDGAANDKVFGVELKPAAGQTSLEYYLTVENANALSFFPEHYQMKKSVITLAELNK